jgi:hypothetical protein
MPLAFPPPVSRRPGVAGTWRWNHFVARSRWGHTKINVNVDLGYRRHCDRAQGNQRAEQNVSHGHYSISCLDDFPHLLRDLPESSRQKDNDGDVSAKYLSTSR